MKHWFFLTFGESELFQMPLQSISYMEDTATNSFIDEWNLSNELAGGLPGSLISPDEKLSVITNTDVPAKQ